VFKDEHKGTKNTKGEEKMEFSFMEKKNEYPDPLPGANIDKYFPWINPKRLANMRSLGQGPHYFKHGRSVLYPRDEFLKWLDKSISSPGSRKDKATAEEKKPEKQQVVTPRRGRKTKQQEVRERRGLA
jgi:hypothetical protein